MVAIRAKSIGFLEPDVIELAYKLTKAKNEQEAVAIMRDVPSGTYPSLMKHMHESIGTYSFPRFTWPYRWR
jgi:hypothetical protein